MTAKAKLNLVVCGHVDAGKSTLMGHLLYLLGNVSQKQMHKLEKESKQIGKGSFAFAWVLDEQAEERTRGVTVDVGTTFFETPNRAITLLDAPGHRDFIPNMISGASQADVAVLVVDATPGEFESGFDAGGQTKEHVLLIRSLGVSQIVIAVNKMDMVGWSKERFDNVVAQLLAFFKQSGVRERNTRFVPVSGLTGENLTKREDAQLSAWYSGPTLLEAIDTFEEGERSVSKPVRLCVSDVFKSQTLGVAVAGKVEQGTIAVGAKVLLVPGSVSATVKGIECRKEAVKSCSAGDNVEVGLTGCDLTSLSSGQVLCEPSSPVGVHTQFEAQLVTLQIAAPLLPGQQLVMHAQSVQVPAQLSRLVAELDRATGEVKRAKPRALSKNTTAVVEVKLQRGVCLEKYSDCKSLGRFMLRDGSKTVAAGIITRVGPT